MMSLESVANDRLRHRLILPRGQVSGGCGRPTIAAAARWSERTPAQ